MNCFEDILRIACCSVDAMQVRLEDFIPFKV